MCKNLNLYSIFEPFFYVSIFDKPNISNKRKIISSLNPGTNLKFCVAKDKTGSGRTGGCGTPRIEVTVKGGEDGGSGAAGCSVVTQPNSQAVQGARHKRGRSSYTAEERIDF